MPVGAATKGESAEDKINACLKSKRKRDGWTITEVATEVHISPAQASTILWGLVGEGKLYLTWSRRLRLRPKKEHHLKTVSQQVV